MNQAPTTNQDSCGSCLFFRPQEGIAGGTCHRLPPQFAGGDTSNEAHRWKFPTVSHFAWCGEYRWDSGEARSAEAGPPSPTA